MFNKISNKFFFQMVIKYRCITFYNIVMNFFFILSIIWLTPFLLFFILIKYSKKFLCPPNWTKIFKFLYEVSNIKFLLSFSGFAVIFYIVLNFVMFNNTFDNWPDPFAFDDYVGNFFVSNDVIKKNYRLVLQYFGYFRDNKYLPFNEDINVKYFNESIDHSYFNSKTFFSQSRVKLYSIYIYLFLLILLILHILLGFLGLSYDYFLKNYSFINNFFLGFSWLQIFFILFKFFFIIIV